MQRPKFVTIQIEHELYPVLHGIGRWRVKGVLFFSYEPCSPWCNIEFILPTFVVGMWMFVPDYRSKNARTPGFCQIPDQTFSIIPKESKVRSSTVPRTIAV
jgi:hypothetical protein